MPIVRHLPEEARRKAKVRRRVIAATSEATIARQAARDGTATGAVDFVKALEEGPPAPSCSPSAAIPRP